MSVADVTIQKKIYGSGTLIISSEEMEDIIKIVIHLKNHDC